ncbi:hypothetical protein [Brevirhabdus sp.]|uniref:hypothetical protein n=1 Tax=Brevirhabdus sp. TaxID=2004514 RepID=UPI0040594D55
MRKIKSMAASLLALAVVVAGLGFGLMAVGFAITIGALFALAMRLGGPEMLRRAQERAGQQAGHASEPGSVDTPAEQESAAQDTVVPA